MNNKNLGLILILVCVLIGFMVFAFDNQISEHETMACSCEEMADGGLCPMEDGGHWQTYLGVIIASLIGALGVYLIFFEKSQKEIVKTLERQKRIQTEEEKFEILLKGLDESEKKVIKAVKEQDGITQQTLRLRTGLHKSKLSIVLDGLEKKELVTRKEKGKTKEVFLKFKI